MIAITLVQSSLDVARNPFEAAQEIDLLFVVKIIVLILALIYVIFAVRVWVQVQRLERWLFLLRGHNFRAWALAHFVLALIGLLLALLVL